MTTETVTTTPARPVCGWTAICKARKELSTSTMAQRRARGNTRKGHDKKKAHVNFCREQVKKGLINHADGGWRNADSSKSMDRDMRAGYKL